MLAFYHAHFLCSHVFYWTCVLLLVGNCLLQNTTDLTDLVSSGRNKNEEENSFIHEYELKGLAFRAERFVQLYPKYSKLFNNQLPLHPLSLWQ